MPEWRSAPMSTTRRAAGLPQRARRARCVLWAVRCGPGAGSARRSPGRARQYRRPDLQPNVDLARRPLCSSAGVLGREWPADRGSTRWAAGWRYGADVLCGFSRASARRNGMRIARALVVLVAVSVLAGCSGLAPYPPYPRIAGLGEEATAPRLAIGDNTLVN